MKINNRFELEQEVYLKTDLDQLKRIVTGMTIRKDSIVYEVTCGLIISHHYDFEMSAEKDMSLSLGLSNK